MCELNAKLEALKAVASNPKAQLDKALASGKKVVGLMPFCPEELAYAVGMQPFGLWGAEMQASESKRYYPAFICSIVHTTLEMGLRGMLEGLSAMMVTPICDSLKGVATNWRFGVKSIPAINVPCGQNRKIAAGLKFNTIQYRKAINALAEIAGVEVKDEDIAKAIAMCNENRTAVLAFTEAAAEHPELISPADRCAVIKAGYFMDRAEHTAQVKALTEDLKAAPASTAKVIRVVTTGILADAPALLKIFADNNLCIVADQVAYESVMLRDQVPVTADPVEGLAQRLAAVEGTSVFFDPTLARGKQLVELAKATKADGVVWVMTKFCDPEEFDYVHDKAMLDEAGISLLAVDTDQQMTDYAQARSAVEAFREIHE